MSLFSGWIHEFLLSRHLPTPTGEPLYTYHTTLDEFQYLQATLCSFIGSKPRSTGVDALMHRDFAFAPAFVAYAAEWWKRRYDGSGWRWEPILQSIGAQADSWHPSDRSACVELGLRGWGIELAASRGFRYLGSVAVQGGLPVQALAAARGSIGRVLERVLRLCAATHATEEEAVQWIESLSSYLPSAYQQREIYYLLAQVIITILQLKNQAGLESSETAIGQLDLRVPNWRNRFPLPIEDLQAQALIEQLVREATHHRTIVSTSPIEVERKLEAIGDNRWQLASLVTVPQYVYESALAQLFSIASDIPLPRTCSLLFEMGRQHVTTSVRRLTGQAQYRLERRPAVATDPDAAAEHFIHLSTQEGVTYSATVPDGEPLAFDMPWLFELSEDGIARFVRQGPGSIRTQTALVAIPAEWKIFPDGDATVDCLGSIVALDRTVIRLCGGCRILDSDEATFRVSSGRVTAALDGHLGWKGKRAWDLIFLSPTVAFRGVPRLMRRLDDETEVGISGPMLWKNSGEKTSAPTGWVGPVDATWPARGEVQFRSRVVLIPENARIAIGTSTSPSVANLEFEHWDLASVGTDTVEVDVAAHRANGSLSTQFTYKGPGSPPEMLDLRLYWRGNATPARVKLPFPARGARAFDKDGQALSQDDKVTLDLLFGVRLVAFLGIGDRALLRFTLFDGPSTLDHAFIDLRPVAGSQRIEVRVVEHIDRIRRMLSSADALDCSVFVELQCGEASPAGVRVTRFACALDKLDLDDVTLSNGCRSAPNVAAAQPLMLRLDRPGDEPILLEACACTSSAMPAWHVPQPELGPGPWLIYPPPGSPTIYRPLLWTIRGQPSESTLQLQPSLASALAIENPCARREVLDNILARLGMNYEDDDWILVEQLANHFGHLPLSVLDVWCAFARSSEAVAALAMRISALPAEFLERFIRRHAKNAAA